MKNRSTALLCAGFLAGIASHASAGDGTSAPLIDTFSNGLNQGGWSYNPGDVIEPSGGKPGAWLHQATADTLSLIHI